MPDKKKWFVTSRDGNWIIATPAGRSKKIGRISKGRGINYRDRAIDEARRRNGDGKHPIIKYAS